MRSLKNVFMRPTERLLCHLLVENQAVYLHFVSFLPTSVDQFIKRITVSAVFFFFCLQPSLSLSAFQTCESSSSSHSYQFFFYFFMAAAIKRKGISKSPSAAWRKLNCRSVELKSLHRKKTLWRHFWQQMSPVVTKEFSQPLKLCRPSWFEVQLQNSLGGSGSQDILKHLVPNGTWNFLTCVWYLWYLSLAPPPPPLQPPH